jgi:hypothetical protein
VPATQEALNGPTQWDVRGEAREEFTAPPPEPFGVNGLARGIVAALGGAVLATLVWYAVVAFSGYQVAIVAAAVGWIIGSAAVWGAGGRGSIWLSAVSVLITIVSLGIGEYLISYHVATSELGVRTPLLRPLDEILAIVLDVLTSDPLTLVFWALAIGLAAYVPFKAIRQTATYPS